MRVTIDIPEPWEELLPAAAERMGCDIEEAFGRAMGLTWSVLVHLREPGATVVFRAPGKRDAELDPAPLFGGAGLDIRRVRASDCL